MYTVYSKPNCHQCDKAISILRNSGVEFEVKKIGVDSSMEDIFNRISNSDKPGFVPRSAPVIFKENRVFETFQDFSSEFDSKIQ